MTGTWTRRRRRPLWAWLFGGAVLAALTFAVTHLIDQAQRDGTAGRPTASAPAPRADAGPGPVRTVDAPVPGVAVGGTVLLPDGQPAVGATVTLRRAITAWPEWRSEVVDQAVTGPSGTFEFRPRERHGLLVEYQHPSFAGGLEQVPVFELPLRLELGPAFELSGVVSNPAGAPVANARVAIEAVIGDDRRMQATTTSANGSYRFTNLRVGPVRLVAQHDSWQPTSVPVVVVGDQSRRDLTFERPAMAPLRGRVTSLVSQEPLAGAGIELLPVNARPGLSDVFATTSADDGTFLLAGLPRGNLRVLVRHPEYGVVSRTLAVGTVAAEIGFELPPRSQVSGRLVDEDDAGRSFAGLVLQIRDLSGELEHVGVAADGSFRCAVPLSPGWASARFVGEGLAFQSTLRNETAFRIEEAGRTEVELVVTAPRVLRGRVVDGTGAPLAGATVSRTRLLSESTQSIGMALWDLDLSLLSSQVAQLFRDDRDELLAVSGADGRFAIAGQDPGMLIARVDRPGHGRRLLRLTVPIGAEVVDIGDVRLEPGCRIEGRVERSGRGLAGATVTAHGGQSQAFTIAGAGGAFRFDDLQPGAYRLRARLPSQPAAAREQHAVTTDAGRPAEGVVLQLEAGRTVRGTVAGSDGQPVPSALVTVRGAAGQTTSTDSGGDFLLELPERAVELQVSLADRSRPLVVPVSALQREVAVQLDTPPVCTVTAQLAGLPGKQRLGGVLVRYAAPGDESGTRLRWLDLHNGQLRWSLCPVGRVRLEFWSDGYAPAVVEREFAAHETHDLGELLLEPGARLDGVVRDENGAPVANAQVWLGEEIDGDLFEPEVRSAADGSFRIGGVTSRSSRLVVRALGFAPRTVDLVLPRDVLAPEPLAVALERGGTIEVVVAPRAGAEGAFVQLRRDGRVVASTDCDENGRAWFGNRSAGEYTVLLPGTEIEAAEVVLPPGVPVVRVRIGG